MKFSELPIGSQFEFEGEPYVKTSPVIASHAQSGKQKFMARYAVVRIAGAAPAAPREEEKLVRAGVVVAAFETFYAHCLDALEGENREAAREKLSRARKVFLDSLH